VPLGQRPVATQALGLTTAHVIRFGCYQSSIFASKLEFERQRMRRRGMARAGVRIDTSAVIWNGSKPID